MANSESVKRSVNIYIDSGDAQKTLDALILKENKLKDALGKATDPKQQKALNDELAKMQEPLDRATKKVKGELGPSLKDLQSTVAKLSAQLKKMSTEDADFSKTLGQYNQARQQLNQLSDAVNQVKKAQGGEQGGGLFGKIFGGALAADMVGRGIELVKENIGQAVEWALQLEGVKRGYDKLNKPDLLNELRAATHGTITDLELMKKAVQANNFQIPLEKLGTLMEFAHRRAEETGKSVDDLMNSLMTGLARQSTRPFVQLGISNKQLQEELKKTGNFAQATFKIIDDELEAMGPALETNAVKVERFKATWANWWTEIGTGAVEVGSNVAGFFETIFSAANGFFGNFGEAAANMATKQAEKMQQDRARVIQGGYDFELRMIQQFGTDFAGADKAGREKIINEAQGQWQIINNDLQRALANHETQQAASLRRQLSLWTEFVKKIKEQAALGSSQTLAGIDAQIEEANQTIQTALIGSKEFKDAQLELKALQKQRDDASGKTAEEAATKQEAAARKAADKRKAANDKETADKKHLKEELDKLEATMIMANETTTDKEIKATVEKYNELKKLAHGDAVLTLKIEKDRDEAIHQILVKSLNEDFEVTKKAFEKRDKLIREGVEKFIEGTSKLKIPELVSDSVAADKLVQHQLDLTSATGKKKLELQKGDLQKQEDAEIKALQARGISSATQEKAIHEKYQKERDKLDTDHFAKQAGQYLAFAQSAMGILDTINQAKTAAENAELERDKRANDEKKANLDKRLKDGLISQKQHDDEIKKLDDAYSKRQHELAVKQFKRNQRMQIVQALMNGASAVVKILAETPKFDFGVMTAIEIGLAAATTAAEVAAIASQKPPEFGHGGLLDGPLHGQGGMGVYDQHGRKQAEMEGGEGIANRRTMGDPNTYQVTGTPSQIISRLNAMGGGVSWASGATAVPAWSVQQPQQVNFSAVNASIGTMRRHYASGGVFDNAESSVATSQSQDQLNNTLKFLTGAIVGLQQQMQSPIKAYTVLTEHEATADRLKAIRDDATMKG
jgi:hypothetical protein